MIYRFYLGFGSLYNIQKLLFEGIQANLLTSGSLELSNGLMVQFKYTWSVLLLEVITNHMTLIMMKLLAQSLN